MALSQPLHEVLDYDIAEIRLWLAYFDGFDPYPSSNWQAASICSTLANCNRDPKRKPKPYEPADFMPRTRKPAMTGAQISAELFKCAIPSK